MKAQKMIIASMLGLALVSGKAFAGDFDEGEKHLSLGYGLATWTGAILDAYEGYGDYSHSATGPIHIKFEYGVSEKMGVGLNLAYVVHKMKYNYDDFDTNGNPVVYTETTDYTTWSALMRLNWHFGDIDHFDPYWGIGVGYRSGKWKVTSNDPTGETSGTEVDEPIPFGFESTIGARYHFTDNFGAYMEVGLAKSVLQVGATMRF
jgi:opacity protein-like surface antigen